MASHGGTAVQSADILVANAMVAARLLNIQFDPSFLEDDMQACDVMNPSFLGEEIEACDVIGNGGEGAQPERQHQADTPPRKVAPISDSDSDSDNDDTRKNKRDALIERLECALQDVQTSVFQNARIDLDGSLEKVKLRSLQSFWHYYNEFDDYDGELNEFDDEALNLIGTYVELKDDVDLFCVYGDQDSEISRLAKHLGAQEIWMTRDFLGAAREREDAQTYGAEVLREFYGEDYW